VKFCARNDLSIFEFHDSEFSFISFDGLDLVVSASMVNIHKDTPLNPSDCDMEIASAQITFKNFHSATYEPGRTWKTDEDGKSYPVGPCVVYSGQDGIDRILEELKNEIAVYHFEKKDRGYSIGGCGIEPYFTMEFDLIVLLSVGTNTRRKHGTNCIGNIGMMLYCGLQMAMKKCS